MSLVSRAVLEMDFCQFWRYFMACQQISGILQHLFGFGALTTLIYNGFGCISLEK